MYRPVFTAPISNSPLWRQNWARLIVPITLWICVSVSLRFGYYGDYRIVLGPTSSRLLTASSMFVERVEARVDDRKGVLLHGFSEKPELSLEMNWNVSKYLVVGSYSRKGFSMWLNKGSKIQMRWETQTSILDQLLQLTMIKGERKYEELLPNLTSAFDVPPAQNEPLNGKETEYIIEEDDKYYVGLINNNHRNIITSMTLNVTSRMYNLTKANNICSSQTGSCLLKLTFPDTKFIVLTTPDTVDEDGWYIEIAFVARVVTYVAILALFMVIIILALKYLGTFDIEETTNNTEDQEIQYTNINVASETTPILRDYNQWRSRYGTSKAEGENGNDDDDTDSSSSDSSSEDLYDAKLCVICYDDQRNCFFVPCGHCATCYNCAQRIMSEDSKMCPICRRLIHKVRRLFSP